jgi:predicted O-linked N-acetylglucosamine transferase (SPINDLY family)
MACCREALAINPDFARARGGMVMYHLPAVFDDGQSVAGARTAFARELSELDSWLEAKRPVDGYGALDNVRVFYLAYQEEDNRDLLSRYGDLCARTLRRWQDSQAPTGRSPARGGKIRIGIVLAYVKDTAVWNAIVRGWVEHFDRIRFELNLFQLEPGHDAQTAFAMSRTSHFDLTEKGLRECVDSILERELDVLIYPEIGMHPKVAVLASLRLAPVQAASWGHPETSGLPTIDYFLSAEDLEPPGAQRNYREQLVELPQLGCCYSAPAINPVVPDLGRLGIASDRPLLICAGTPFKYAPEFDWVLVEMARRLGSCQFVFFIHEQSYLSEKLRLRLEAAFARGGLAFRDYAVFIPWQSGPQFHGLLARADVLLDTIGFSGFNTAMQSVACGLPVATREGRFLRGRLASGVLKRIGLSELVATTEEEYVALAIKLAGDPAYRQLIRRRIEASRHVLFDNVAPIRALEQFCANVVKRT